MQANRNASPKFSLEQIYLSLANDSTLWNLDQASFLQFICKKISMQLQVDRVSIYILEKDGDTLKQVNQFVKSRNTHYSGFSFRKSEFPILHQMLKDFRIIEINNAKENPALKELIDRYILPLDIESVVLCPLYNLGKHIATVNIEHIGTKRLWSDEEKRFLISMSDLVSQRLNTSRVQEENSIRYRAIFDNSPNSMFLMQDKFFIDCNQAALDLFNCTREDILYKTPYDFSPLQTHEGLNTEDTPKQNYQKLEKALAGEEQCFEFTHQRLDGSIFETEIILNKIVIDGKTLLLNNMRDITERKRSEQYILNQNKYLEIINELSSQLQGTYSIDEIYKHTINAIEKLPNPPIAAIYTLQPCKQFFKFKIGLKTNSGIQKDFSQLPVVKEFQDRDLEFDKTRFSPIKSDHSAIVNAPLKDSLKKHNLKSLARIPFIVKGERIAILLIAHHEEKSANRNEIEAFNSISRTVSIAIENAKNHAKLNHMAHTDSLTDLGNRADFHKNFKEFAENSKSKNAALYLLDLNRFKEINDTLGHFAGDKILKKIGSRLKSIKHKKPLFVNRLGGDEFIVFAYGVKSKRMANNIANQILEKIRAPFDIDDISLEIDSSVGIAKYPKDGKNSHDLLRSADVAMYQAKKQRISHVHYKEERDIHTPQRLAMISELGNSINTGQLHLHYQPKVNLTDNSIDGFEALARWEHPRLGDLSPSVFIPLIEMSDSIHQLTEEVMRQALAKQSMWRLLGHDYSVSVNISARNLSDKRIIKSLKKLLKTYNTPPHLLELEITETALMHDTDRAINYLKEISKLGVQLSLDDFGSGHSSLAYIHKLPINKIKLDREFISSLLESKESESVVKSVISLSKELNFRVVAEGVENQGTVDKLLELHCDQAQGYHICKPKPWSEIESWLNVA